MNERFTINGSVIETTESYSYSYNGESSSSSEQDLMAYDGSVFLLDYADAWMDEGDYGLELDAYYSEYGLIEAYGNGLSFCEDGSGFATGTIEFYDDESTAMLITFNGCGVAPSVTPIVSL